MPLGVPADPRGARLPDERGGLQVAGEPAVANVQRRRHDVVEERTEGLHERRQGPRDEHRPVPGRAVLPESARGEAGGDAGMSLNPVANLTSLVADIAARGNARGANGEKNATPARFRRQEG